MKFLPNLCLIFAAAFVFVGQSLEAACGSESRVDLLRAIVLDAGMSFSSKLDALDGFSGSSFCTGSYYEVLLPLLEELLRQGKRERHVGGMLFCYNFMADLYLGLWERERARMCLDSAAMLAGKTDERRFLAPYFRMKGQYIQRYCPVRSPEAIDYYHRSLSYYEEAGFEGKENDVVIVLRNLVFDGFQRNDSAYVHRYMERIAGMRKGFVSPMIDFALMDTKAALHDFYFQRSLVEAHLDSSIYYAKEGLKIYERGGLSRIYKYVATDLYVVVAGQTGRKKDADLCVVDSLLSIAYTKYEADDSIGMGRVYLAKAKVLYDRNLMDSAERVALRAQRHLEAGPGYRTNYYPPVKVNISLLRDIYHAKGDYRKVIEYEDLWMRKDREIRANEIKELELRYEVEAKETEIERLDSDRLYQGSLYKRFFLICCLLCLAIAFVFLLLRLKKRDLNNQIALIHAEKEEAKLKLKLREEQAVKVQLEKYEVLSDFHLKEMELIGKSKDLDLLRQDKAALDEQVELYRRKIEAYESVMNKGKAADYDTYNVIIKDLIFLISKHIKFPPGDEYIHNIEHLSISHIEIFREKSNENLSISYLKYCICFAVGMEIAEVAECFCIEPSSVHMIRYRLKKKFGLENDDDLGLFLRKYSMRQSDGGVEGFP
jgi:hypothetical protein